MFLSAIQISNFFRCIYKISVFEVGANIFVRNVSNPELSTSCLKHAFLSYQYQMKILLSFQLKCSSNIDSIHYLGLTNSFDRKLINFLLLLNEPIRFRFRTD